MVVTIAGLRTLLISGRAEPRTKMPLRRRIVIGTVVGDFAGFIAGLLGIGGGVIIAPMLMAMGYLIKEVAATTAFAVTFSSFSGFLGHMAEGHLDPWLMGLSIVAVIAGSQLGAWFMAAKAHPAWVKELYGIVLLAVAAKLLHGLLSDGVVRRAVRMSRRNVKPQSLIRRLL